MFTCFSKRVMEAPCRKYSTMVRQSCSSNDITLRLYFILLDRNVIFPVIPDNLRTQEH